MQVCKQAAEETPVGTAVSEVTCGDTNRCRCVSGRLRRHQLVQLCQRPPVETPTGIGVYI